MNNNSEIQNPNSKILRILLIEDNPGDVRLIKEMLSESKLVKFDVETADRLSSGLKLIANNRFDVILLDLGLPDSQGLGTLIKLNEIKSDAPVIVLTGLKDESAGVQSVKEGAQDYLIKGQVDSSQLVRSLHYAIERKRAEEAMREQSRIFEAFFENTVTQLVFLDKHFNFIRVNNAYAKSCQRDISEFPGHNHFEFYPSDAKVIFERVVETKESFQAIANPFIFPDHPEWGVTYWDWILTPILDNKGEVEYLVFSLNDVTERKQLERQKALIAELGTQAISSGELSELFDSAVAFVRQGLNLEFSKVLELLPTGKELIMRAGVGWKEGYVGHATVTSGKESQAGYTLQSEGPVIVENFKQETRFKFPSLLQEHNIISGISAVIGAKERPYGVLGAHTVKERKFSVDDINFVQSVANILSNAITHKMAQQTLQKSEAFIRNILESVGEGFIVVDPEYKIITANRAYSNTVMMPIEGIIGKHCYEVSHHVNKPCHETGEDCPVKHVFETGQSSVIIHKHFVKDGNPVYVETKAYPIKDASGIVISVIETIQDITEKMNADKEIKERVRELEEFYKMAVGRELRMKDLKKQMENLREELKEYKKP